MSDSNEPKTRVGTRLQRSPDHLLQPTPDAQSRGPNPRQQVKTVSIPQGVVSRLAASASGVGALTESLRYFLGRYRLANGGRFPTPLAVTSALHGEGVSTISMALASVVVTDFDASVCWIDLSPVSSAADRRSSTDTTHRGVWEVINGGVRLQDVLEATEDPRFQVLRAGSATPDEWRALAQSTQLETLIAQVASEFDFVVLDVPPILGGSEVFGLIRHAAAYLLVVRHGVTSTQQLRAASDELGSMNGLGVVVNQFTTRIPRRLTRFFPMICPVERR